MADLRGNFRINVGPAPAFEYTSLLSSLPLSYNARVDTRMDRSKKKRVSRDGIVNVDTSGAYAAEMLSDNDTLHGQFVQVCLFFHFLVI